MGLDKEGICILRPHTTCLTECVEGKVSSRCDCEKWTSVGKFVDVLGVVELEEIKADILKYLYYFLSSSAATFKYPPLGSNEDIMLSAVVGETEVYIIYDDLVALHNYLLREVGRHVPLFSAKDDKFGEIHFVFPPTLLELKVTALTLRCCIRLLPLMELFDTGLRNVMGMGLNNLLQKIGSPREPCLLSKNAFALQRAASNIDPHRAPTLCALLEVFIDELSCYSKTQLVLVQDTKLELGDPSTSRLILEATLAHVMISAHGPEELHDLRARVCELSLQSAVKLLDRVITDNVPRYLLSHVVRTVSRALQGSACISDSSHSSVKLEQEFQKNRKKWFSRFPIAGHSNEAASDKINTCFSPHSNSWQVNIWLVYSVLERGVSLYMKFASAPHLANLGRCLDDGQLPSGAVSNTVLASCLWKYVCHRGQMSQECESALESMLNDATLRKGLEESMDQTYCHDHRHMQGLGQEADLVHQVLYPNSNIERSSGTYFCGRELCNVPVWEEDQSTLISDVLHLMHSALNFITGKVRLVGESFQDNLAADMTRDDIDNIWLGLIGSFHQCLPFARDITAADSVGHVIVFFTDMLYYEAKKSISDKKLREYLELLESLTISLLLEHTWRKNRSFSLPVDDMFGQNGTMDVDSCSREAQESISPSCYASKVVSSLQKFLEEPQLLEMLGGNAVSIIYQINFFLNDFCEFMDNVLSTNAWREYLPANGRRDLIKGPEVVQREVDEVDRNAWAADLEHDMHIFKGSPSPEEKREPSKHQLCGRNIDEQQSPGMEREPAQHNHSRSVNVEKQLHPNEERESSEHQPCSAHLGLEKQQLRPSTLPILKRLMKHRIRSAKSSDASPQRLVLSSTCIQL
uniref:DUF7812 domain-containing protein n=2 Tax=Physcomitrium patens TaxID=3218 RepID=A0A7I4B2P0_PHYPA